MRLRPTEEYYRHADRAPAPYYGEPSAPPAADSPPAPDDAYYAPPAYYAPVLASYAYGGYGGYGGFYSGYRGYRPYPRPSSGWHSHVRGGANWAGHGVSRPVLVSRGPGVSRQFVGGAGVGGRAMVSSGHGGGGRR